MIEIVGDSIRLRVHAIPGAKRNCIGGCHDDALKVSVTAVADKGKANKAIVKLLGKTFTLRQSQIELLSGTTSRRKLLAIHDPPTGLVDALNQAAERV